MVSIAASPEQACRGGRGCAAGVGRGRVDEDGVSATG
jgi:hypothetical protein